MVARIRSVKPEFFQHEAIFDAEAESGGLPLRLAFIGLWTQADRRGLFRWKPRELKLNILPWDNVDFGAILDALEKHAFVLSYVVDGERFGWIPSFEKHQKFHIREQSCASIPHPPKGLSARCQHGASTVLARGLVSGGEGRYGEGEGGGPGEGAERRAAPALGGGPPAPEQNAESNPFAVPLTEEALIEFRERQRRVVATLLAPRESGS